MDNGQRANIANIGLACKQTSKAITEKWELTPANHRKSNINLNYRDTPIQISYNQVHKPIIKNCSEQINIHDPILPLADLLFAVPITSYACSGAINPKRKKDDDDDDNKKKIIMDKRNIRKETLFNEEEFSLIQQKSLIADIQPAVFIRETALSKDIKAALSQQEIDMIRRNQKVSVALQTNLNQIANLCHTYGFLPLSDYITQLIRNIDRYFQTGGWTSINIPDNIQQLEDILKEADAKYRDLKNKALNLFYFTHEGEKFFKERYKCSIFSNNQNTKYYFRVQGSNKLAIEIPEQLFNDYRNRKASIKDIYDYWITQQ